MKGLQSENKKLHFDSVEAGEAMKEFKETGDAVHDQWERNFILPTAFCKDWSRKAREEGVVCRGEIMRNLTRVFSVLVERNAAL